MVCRLGAGGVGPGVTQVSDGWRALGQVEVVQYAGFAHEQL